MSITLLPGDQNTPYSRSVAARDPIIVRQIAGELLVRRYRVSIWFVF